jgi:hypothetical protein
MIRDDHDVGSATVTDETVPDSWARWPGRSSKSPSESVMSFVIRLRPPGGHFLSKGGRGEAERRDEAPGPAVDWAWRFQAEQVMLPISL